MEGKRAIRRADGERAWLSVTQLCVRWQLNRKTIYKFIAAEILPAWRVGPRMYRVAVADVLRFEERNRLRASAADHSPLKK
jgi:excisionase family DNA binding protein